MIEIGMHKICKNFGYKQILKEVSFEILTNDRVGIVGKNGSGKTTLFKTMMKKEFPDTGAVTIRKNATIGYLEQIPTIKNVDFTTKEVLMESFSKFYEIEKKMRVLEIEMLQDASNEEILNKYANVQNQFISEGGYEIEEKLSKVINGFKLQSILDKPFSILSGGQKTVINLAKLILKEPDILLLDEPTNHLDVNMLEWLEGYLRKYKGTVVIISHDRYFLDEVTNKTILLDDGESRLFHGNYSYSLREQEKLLLQEFEQYKTQQKKIDAMKASIKRYRDWGNRADNEKFFKKAKELEKRLEKMEILDKPQLEKKKIPISFEGQRISNEAVKAKNFGIGFTGLRLFENSNFTLYYQEKVVLLGNNGTGKSTFINALLGNFNAYEGDLVVAETVKIGYIPQEIRFENNKDTILSAFRKEYPCLEGEARNILAKYDFYKDLVFNRVGTLSGGEKVLLKLAILMQHQVNFLILDEPTNHIDIDTREILEQALLAYTGTLLFVSHDRYFIDKIANRILEIKDKKIYDYYGTYNDYK
ncbi:MAG: ribosomal protection-like ABC-F family protein [Coprobacillaceae bacterium]